MGDKALQRQIDILLHELKMPVVAIRGAIEFARRELAQRKIIFDRDYLEDAWNYSELISTLLLNASLFRDSDQQIISERIDKKSFLSSILYTSVQGVNLFLRERGYNSSAIQLNNIDLIPPLYVDPQKMYLVFFNLFSNAIKYSMPNNLRITVKAETSDNGWHILVSNWGMGIAPAEAMLIFQEGFRGKREELNEVSGRGLGLFIIRSILDSHDCSISLTRHHNPTVFTLSLPSSLAERRDV